MGYFLKNMQWLDNLNHINMFDKSNHQLNNLKRLIQENKQMKLYY